MRKRRVAAMVGSNAITMEKRMKFLLAILMLVFLSVPPARAGDMCTYSADISPDNSDIVLTSDNACAESNKTTSIGSIREGVEQEYCFALSDQTTLLTTGTAKYTAYLSDAVTVKSVRAFVNEAPTGSVVTVDINEAGTTILSTKLTIDATEQTSRTAATPAFISDHDIAADAKLTFDIDTIGSGSAGKGLVACLAVTF
jgi:hypothetical protein